MSGYAKLLGESFDFDYEDIQNNLKGFNSKLKEYQRSPNKSKKVIYPELEKKQSRLQEIFNRPRTNLSDKAKLETLEKQFKELSLNFSKIKPNFELESELSPSDHKKHDDVLDGIVENEDLAIQDINSIREKEYIARKENVDKLHKDMVTVNEMFKDSAKMIHEQGHMLVDSENNLMVAVEQTGTGVQELQKADVYQQKAKRKLCCICVIAVVAVAVLLAIILGVIYK